MLTQGTPEWRGPERGAATQLVCFGDALLCHALADSQARGQRLGKAGGAERFGSRLGGELVDQRMFDSGQATTVSL